MVPSLVEIVYNTLTNGDKCAIREQAKKNFIYEHIFTIIEIERIRRLHKHKQGFLRVIRFIRVNKSKFKQILLLQKMIQDEITLKQIFIGVTLTNTRSIFCLMSSYVDKERIDIDKNELFENISNFCLTFILNLDYNMLKEKNIYEQQYSLVSNKLSLPNWYLFLTLIDKEILDKYIIVEHSIYRYADPKLWTKYMWVLYYTHQLYYRFYWFSIDVMLDNNMLPLFLLTKSCTNLRSDFINVDKNDPLLTIKIYDYLCGINKEEFYKFSPFFPRF